MKRKRQKQKNNVPREIKDNSYKRIFDDPELFCQFIKDFIDIAYLKEITPDDMEDYTNTFLPIHSNRRETDVIKVVRVKDMLVIALIEHQSNVDYLMPFRILEYMTLIWNKWIQLMERKKSGCSKSKDFLLPPIIPIVYFSSVGNWTAEINFFARVSDNKIFEKYIPAFEYELISLAKYSVEDLMKFEDMLSFILLIDKIKRPDEIKSILSSIDMVYISHIKEKIPDNLLELLSCIIAGFLAKANIPENEMSEIIDHISKRRFEHMLEMVEKYDVQEVRISAHKEGIEEGIKKGIDEGIKKGINNTLLIIQELKSGKEISEISKAYNMSMDKITQIQNLIKEK